MDDAETVEYRGIKFRRYPDADDWATRNYYRPSATHIEQGVEALHREVYKDHHGEIPDGYAVHHIDGDTANNDPGNLEAASVEDHQKHHDDPPENWETYLERARHFAKRWHQSAEGREWHREHWEDSLGKEFEGFDGNEKECDYCGDSFVDESLQQSGRFCSNNCKTQHRRESGVDDVERECVICGDGFETNKYQPSETCSRSCATKLAWQDR